MPEYECYPLWMEIDAGVQNVDPAGLPISDKLRSELSAWASAYDVTYNHSDPVASGFASEDDKRRFVGEGLRLARQLMVELGETVRVEYFDVSVSRVVPLG